MTLEFHKSFHKQAERLKPAQKDRLKVALRLFQDDPINPKLYNHTLSGEWSGHNSITFGGDWRAHYLMSEPDTALFVAVGTHN